MADLSPLLFFVPIALVLGLGLCVVVFLVWRDSQWFVDLGWLEDVVRERRAERLAREARAQLAAKRKSGP
ncbi:MAG: hypothetical protein ABUS48_04110 [Pseudomonadota bacterium]